MKICLGKDKGILALSIFLGAVNAVAIAFVSIALQRIVDIALAGDLDGFGKLLIVIMVYMIALCIMGFAEALCGKVMLRNVTKNLRQRIFKGVMNKEPDGYYKSNSADYLSAVVNDVKLVEENYLVPLLLSSQMIVLFVATLGILCYLSPIVTAILVGFLLLMFLVPAVFGKALQKRQDQYSDKLARFTAKTKDFFSGYEVIRAFSIEARIQKKFQKENQETAGAKFRADRLIAVNESLADMLSTLSTVIVVFTAAYMVLRGNITAGTLLALIQLSSTFSMPVLIIMQNMPKMKGMKPIMKKLEHLCQVPDERKEGTELQENLPFERLELKNVKFGYEPDKNVIDGIDFIFDSGKKYALLGDSGCGKTTLTRLLTGYSKQYKGSISYDGREVKTMWSRDFSRLISVIHQNVYLFDSDIMENICLGEEFSQQELQQALEKSGVSNFIGQFPDGVNTKVGENGNRLSGGQRQRIAVARALIRQTPLIILDEGTSAVDQKTACAIEKELLQEPKLTLITITHHMHSTLEAYYDKIIYIEEGKIRG